jgi:hypothetical protein
MKDSTDGMQPLRGLQLREFLALEHRISESGFRMIFMRFCSYSYDLGRHSLSSEANSQPVAVSHGSVETHVCFAWKLELG